MTDEPKNDYELLLSVVRTMTENGRRVATAAAAEAKSEGRREYTRYVTDAIASETRGILAGSDPGRQSLRRAISATGNALETLAGQALAAQPEDPATAISQAFDAFEDYMAGPGREQILARINASDDDAS